MNSLEDIALKSIIKQVKKNEVSLRELHKKLNMYNFEAVLNHLYDYDLNICRDKLYNSLIEIESRRWKDVSINFNKYYDEAGYRDWYEDIEIIYDDNELDDSISNDDEVLEDDDEEKYNPNIKIIRQYVDPFYSYYITKARKWCHDEYSDIESLDAF